MAVRQIIACDNCGAEPADPLNVDVGNAVGVRVDLCDGCQQAVGLMRLEELLEEYGKPAGAAKPVGLSRAARRASAATVPPSEREVACPFCGDRMRSRSSVLIHAQGVHGLSKIEASRQMPFPPGSARPAECKRCGYLASGPQGLGAHTSIEHRDER